MVSNNVSLNFDYPLASAATSSGAGSSAHAANPGEFTLCTLPSFDDPLPPQPTPGGIANSSHLTENVAVAAAAAAAAAVAAFATPSNFSSSITCHGASPGGATFASLPTLMNSDSSIPVYSTYRTLNFRAYSCEELNSMVTPAFMAAASAIQAVEIGRKIVRERRPDDLVDSVFTRVSLLGGGEDIAIASQEDQEEDPIIPPEQFYEEDFDWLHDLSRYNTERVFRNNQYQILGMPEQIDGQFLRLIHNKGKSAKEVIAGTKKQYQQLAEWYQSQVKPALAYAIRRYGGAFIKIASVTNKTKVEDMDFSKAVDQDLRDIFGSTSVDSATRETFAFLEAGKTLRVTNPDQAFIELVQSERISYSVLFHFSYRQPIFIYIRGFNSNINPLLEFRTVVAKADRCSSCLRDPATMPARIAFLNRVASNAARERNMPPLVASHEVCEKQQEYPEGPETLAITEINTPFLRDANLNPILPARNLFCTAVSNRQRACFMSIRQDLFSATGIQTTHTVADFYLRIRVLRDPYLWGIVEADNDDMLIECNPPPTLPEDVILNPDEGKFIGFYLINSFKNSDHPSNQAYIDAKNALKLFYAQNNPIDTDTVVKKHLDKIKDIISSYIDVATTSLYNLRPYQDRHYSWLRPQIDPVTGVRSPEIRIGVMSFYWAYLSDILDHNQLGGTNHIPLTSQQFKAIVTHPDHINASTPTEMRLVMDKVRKAAVSLGPEIRLNQFQNAVSALNTVTEDALIAAQRVATYEYFDQAIFTAARARGIAYNVLFGHKAILDALAEAADDGICYQLTGPVRNTNVYTSTAAAAAPGDMKIVFVDSTAAADSGDDDEDGEDSEDDENNV